MSPPLGPDVCLSMRGDVFGPDMVSKMFAGKNENEGVSLQLSLVAFAYVWSRELGGKCAETHDVDVAHRRKMMMLIQQGVRCCDGNWIPVTRTR